MPLIKCTMKYLLHICCKLESVYVRNNYESRVNPIVREFTDYIQRSY